VLRGHEAHLVRVRVRARVRDRVRVRDRDRVRVRVGVRVRVRVRVKVLRGHEAHHAGALVVHADEQLRPLVPREQLRTWC